MLVLITYDVNTQTSQGVKRLSRVAKVCTNYGQRVQNSVFECLIDTTQFVMIKKQLIDIIDEEKDSIRYYILGDKYKNKVEHIGVQKSFDLSGTLII
ncbi:CRISPR-associated endonuclease Cas2 [Lachnospiraceae bacterium 48-33]